MNLTNYHRSMLRKIELPMHGKVIQNIVYLFDEDKDVIDNVVYLEFNDKSVVAFYKNDSNPLVSYNYIYYLDDFNLFSCYESITPKEIENFIPFNIDLIKLIFHSDYNELLGVYLSATLSNKSLFLIFSQDEIYVYFDVEIASINSLIKEKLIHFSNLELLSIDYCNS
ncbi:hypothetical protein [Leminorella grimontii]|uniref:hypothetical protein n=1 Tax=Leminorella grimontii TaxID=82981 RepID=UPI00208A4ACF|nr:hypothetical protein [Leminorella grimontii]GKX60222.1 hypothetical protein SOASR031_25370 [Leminorella grimontii]